MKIIDSPAYSIADTFYSDGIDYIANCHAEIIKMAKDSWEFEIIHNHTQEVLAKSGFSFNSKDDAYEWLLAQIDTIER